MKASLLISSLVTAGLIISGCGDSGGSSNSAYKVTLKNLTYGQPISPVAYVLHDRDYTLFTPAAKASVALEKVAEGGDNSDLISEAISNGEIAVSGKAPIIGGSTETVEISAMNSECISIVGMLVNTNDGFVGVSCIDISNLKMGESMSVTLNSYDAGTEANSETAATIPGPAGGGEGFNATRDDRDFITMHSGVVTKDDGLENSTLSFSNRWDNPVATITIERN